MTQGTLCYIIMSCHFPSYGAIEDLYHILLNSEQLFVEGILMALLLGTKDSGQSEPTPLSLGWFFELRYTLSGHFNRNYSICDHSCTCPINQSYDSITKQEITNIHVKTVNVDTKHHNGEISLTLKNLAWIFSYSIWTSLSPFKPQIPVLGWQEQHLTWSCCGLLFQLCCLKAPYVMHLSYITIVFFFFSTLY